MILVVGGGGGGKLKNTDAVLIVTVPTGSTVTATKSGVTLTPTMWVKAADASLDCAIVSIPASQFDSTTPWTVTATLNSDTASTTVLITTNKEYEVELSFRYMLYNNGVIAAELGAWSGKASYQHNPTIVDADGVLTVINDSSPCSKGNFANSVSGASLLSHGTALYFSVNITDGTGAPASYTDMMRLGLFDRDLPGAGTNYGYAQGYAKASYNVPNGVTTSGYQVFSIDISSIGSTTNYYLGIIAVAVSATVNEIWVR